MTTLELTEEEDRMLAGERGEAVREALLGQVAVGSFFGARRFVPIRQAHIMADWEVMGSAGCEYLERILDQGGAVNVQTTSNAKSVDDEHIASLRQLPELTEGERRVAALVRRLGVTMVNSCIGYQTIYQPRFQEHVACGDTGAAIYANSVLGARTNFESGTAGIAAAVTGRVPEYGFHLGELRRANTRCRVEAELPDVAHWGALGAVVGAALRDYWCVPVLEIANATPGSDELKHLGAALASYGSMAMFHVVGATPEAATLERAIQGREQVDELVVRQADIDAVMTAGEAGAIDLVVFTAPQLSLPELGRIAKLLRGRRIDPGTVLLVTTSLATKAAATDEGYVQAIEDAGGLVMQGVCWYLMAPQVMRAQFGWERLVTNSAKLSNIITAHGYRPALRTTAECVEAAVSGRLA